MAAVNTLTGGASGFADSRLLPDLAEEWATAQAGGPPGSRGRPVSFDFGDPQLEHGYDRGRACRTPS